MVTFGANAKLPCPCGEQMGVVRRTYHPLYGCDYELQTFWCMICDEKRIRAVDLNGNPHPSVMDDHQDKAAE